MIRTVIIDDEQLAIHWNRKLLEATGQYEVVATFTRANDAVIELKTLQPDLCLLDIEMPGLSGIQLADRIRNLDLRTKVVFVTAYNRYALQAFEVEATDYLLKPVNPEKINQLTARLLKHSTHPPQPSPTNPNTFIRLFGGISLEPIAQQPTTTIKWGYSKAEELFAFFLVNPGRTLDKAEILDALWGETEAVNNSLVHTTVYRMKKALQECGVNVQVEHANFRYTFRFVGEVDLYQFQQFFKPDLRVNAANVDDTRTMLNLYCGPLFGAKSYSWAVFLQNRVHKWFVSAGLKLAEYYLAEQLLGTAEEWLLQMIEITPFEEDVHERLLRTYMLSGDKRSFNRHYQICLAMFKKQLDSDPSRKLKNLYGEFMQDQDGGD